MRELRLDHACFCSFLLLRHGFPWLFDILGMVNFGENPTTKSVAFQWVHGRKGKEGREVKGGAPDDHQQRQVARSDHSAEVG